MLRPITRRITERNTNCKNTATSATLKLCDRCDRRFQTICHILTLTISVLQHCCKCCREYRFCVNFRKFNFQHMLKNRFFYNKQTHHNFFFAILYLDAFATISNVILPFSHSCTRPVADAKLAMIPRG